MRTALHLSWRNPPRIDGGRAKTYVVEHREAAPDGAFGAWHLVACVFEKHAVLEYEPRGQRLEYRIIAANHGGQGTPSASVTVVL